MRRFLVMIAVVGLVAALAASAPAARKARTVKKTYDSMATRGGISAWSDDRYTVFTGRPVEIRTSSGDRSITVSVSDDSGDPVAFIVWVGEHDEDLFCQRSDPLRLTGGEVVKVRPVLEATPTGGVCDSPALPTTGTVTAKIR